MLEQSSIGHDSIEPRLSARERAVLALAAQGLTNQEIAGQLSVSIHGVKFHLASIFRKLGVGNRTAAVAMFLGSAHAGE